MEISGQRSVELNTSMRLRVAIGQSPVVKIIRQHSAKLGFARSVVRQSLHATKRSYRTVARVKPSRWSIRRSSASPACLMSPLPIASATAACRRAISGISAVCL